MTKKIVIAAFILGFTISANAADKDPILKLTFNTTCGVCSNSTKLSPLKVDGHSATSVNGGVKRGVTLTFKCDSRKCRKKFTQKAEVFVANQPMATQVGTGLPGVPK